MKPLIRAGALGLLFISLHAQAQQSQNFDDYVVHYNALNSDLISPQVAKEYGIRRSASRAMLNVTVIKKEAQSEGTAVPAAITATAKNLTGQIRDIRFREINESDEAIYYIGELSVRNLETFDFTLNVLPEGAAETLTVKFRQQFYTE
jgi:hypothetical protein